MTKLQTGIVGAVLAAAVAAPLVIKHQADARLLAKDEALRRQLERSARLESENEQLSNLVVQATGSVAHPNDQINELLRMRGQVSQLQTELQHSRESMSNLLGQLGSVAGQIITNRAAVEMNFRVQDLRDVGTQTLNDALQSTLFALTTGDVTAFQNSAADAQRAASRSRFLAQTKDQLKDIAEVDVGFRSDYLDGSVRFGCQLVETPQAATNSMWRTRSLSLRMRPTTQGWGWDSYSPGGILSSAAMTNRPFPANGWIPPVRPQDGQ